MIDYRVREGGGGGSGLVVGEGRGDFPRQEHTATCDRSSRSRDQKGGRVNMNIFACACNM
jgi:hypothetical protein